MKHIPIPLISDSLNAIKIENNPIEITILKGNILIPRSYNDKLMKLILKESDLISELKNNTKIVENLISTIEHFGGIDGI